MLTYAPMVGGDVVKLLGVVPHDSGGCGGALRYLGISYKDNNSTM